MQGVRPRLLDLFCCAGGAGAGYAAAGFEVVGVDIKAQPHYPFEFHQGDAIEFAKAHGHEFDAIHASPPCQNRCTLTLGTNKGRVYPQLIPATRAALNSTGRPWVMENVPGAPLRKDLMLCGEMFGLAVIRHRYFELDEAALSHGTTQPPHVPHRGRVAGFRHGEWFTGPYFAVYGEGGEGLCRTVAGRYGYRLDRRPEEPGRSCPARVHPPYRRTPHENPVHANRGVLMQTVVMIVEGVLRVPGSEGHYDDGVTLYRSLAAENRVYLLSAAWSEEEMKPWLFKRALRGHIGFKRVYDAGYVDFVMGIRHLQGSRTPAFIIDADLRRAANFITVGYSVLCLARPSYADPRWQPDYKHEPQPWEAVRKELERQEDLRYADERLKERD